MTGREAWRIVEQAHPICSECLRMKAKAVTMARVTGSVRGTASWRGPATGFDHSCTVERV